MAVPTSFLTISMIDYSKERSSFSIPIVTLTAANLVAQTAVIAAFEAAVAGISLMAPVKEDVIQSRSSFPSAVASDTHAQRENKWLVRVHGNTTGKKFSTEIPGADPTLLSASPPSDFADLTNAAIISFVTNAELLWRSPDDGAEAITVDSLELVGRRL